jgi:hypothetical protein
MVIEDPELRVLTGECGVNGRTSGKWVETRWG